MGFNAKILTDSLSPDNSRLTTFEVTFPRMILPEFNTHRTFCLAGDSILEFDLPSGSRKEKYKRVYRMRLDDFVDKWKYGARRTGANPKKEYDLSWIESDKTYFAAEIAAKFGMVSAANINHACKTGVIKATKYYRQWCIRGEDILLWRKSEPEHTRFDMQAKLSGMRIRQLNEDTGDIQTSHVVNVFESGEKEVFEVIAGDFRVAGSKDHRVFTTNGWKTIGDLTNEDYIIVRKFGKKKEEILDPTRLKKIDGAWRAVWQRNEFKSLSSKDPMCRRCKLNKGTEIHHIVPVYEDSNRAFDKENITLVCDACHNIFHKKQNWQGGTYLYGAAAKVNDIISRGIEKTYDLEISGKYPNFIANGIVVHNSRNSASSRAIPVEKMLKRVEEDPFIPTYWGKNQKGMQAEQELDLDSQEKAKTAWLAAKGSAVDWAKTMLELGVHKQITNRLLEPFMWHTVIVTATEWSNFFNLRDNKDAQPEIKTIAQMMKEIYHSSIPKYCENGDWHLPLIDEEDFGLATYRDNTGNVDIETLKKVSVGRCARVSYLTHDGKRDHKADIELHDRLLSSGHMSPFEHIARPLYMSDVNENEYREWLYGKEKAIFHRLTGNFKGWVQYRKTISGESDMLAIRREDE